ncbi:MAG: 3'-5' exonuclease [Candidatus Aceula meridiana]|nr:3'-5' exonuclease [Candidatus Aceula meridiana]
MESFLDKEFVIFDVETTGLSPASGDRIVELAAVKTRNLETIDQFQTLVDPMRPISSGAFEVNRISPGMLSGAPKASQILPGFLDFLSDATIVGHNIRFDLGFLYNEVDLAGLSLEKEFASVDTISLAKKVMPGLGRYPLWRVADALGIEENQTHRAMADVQMTFEVFKRLIKMADEKNMIKELSL